MKRKELFDAAFLAVLVITLSSPLGCSSGGGGAMQAGSDSPQSSAPSGSQAAATRFDGKVVETMDGGSYTYALLEREGEQVWVAGPHTALKVGDEISVGLDMRMDDFESPSLSRTFDSIYFVSSLGSEMKSDGPAMKGNPHAGLSELGSSMDNEPIDPGSIEKPDGGYRVAELYGQRDGLAGKQVVVRGRVVKYNGGIMGRNWLHIRDGSGDLEKGTADLTVTSDAMAAVGDLVTVRGVVGLNKDFGAGYSYELIIEEASVKVE